MFSKSVFYYWPESECSQNDVPSWIKTLLQKEEGTILFAGCENSAGFSSLYQHFADLMGCKNHLNTPSFIYHVCPSMSSRYILSASWRHFYYESFIVQDSSLKDSLQENLSTPLLDRIFLNTLRIPSFLEALIVTPLWISLCCADHHIYPSRLLPLFFSYPQNSFPTSPFSSMRLLLLGAKIQSSTKPCLRDAHDRQLLLQACTQMNLCVAKHYHQATHILWCFNDKGFFAKRHSCKTFQMKKKIFQCLIWAQTRSCPIIHLEWLWKVYHEEAFPSFESYELTFQPTHTQWMLSKDVAAQKEDFFCDDKSTLWDCTEHFNSFCKTTLFSYTRPVLPSFLCFCHNLKSPSSLGLKHLNETKHEQTSNFQNESDDIPEKEIFGSLITNYLLKKNVPYKTSQTVWIISSSFSLSEALAVASLLKKTFFLDHIFFANELCISLLPLLVDAFTKLRKNEEWDATENLQLLLTAQELFIVRLEECENQSHAVCGCCLAQFHSDTTSNFSHFFPLCQQATHPIVITKTLCHKVVNELKSFLTVLCDTSFTTSPMNETTFLTKLKEHSIVIKLSLLLLSSLNTSTVRTQESEVQDQQASMSTQSMKPFSSHLLTDSVISRNEWTITFITLGETWERYLKKSANSSQTSCARFTPSFSTQPKQSFLHPSPLSFETVSLVELLNSPFLPQHCRLSNTTLVNNASRPQSTPTMKVLYQGYPYKNSILTCEQNITYDVYKQVYYQLDHINKKEYREFFSSISIVHTDTKSCPYK